jgi:hypothetical protein
MNRSIESSETQLVLFRSINHGSQCSRPGDSLLPASVSAQARLSLAITPRDRQKKHGNVRTYIVPVCPLHVVHFCLCPYASFLGLLYQRGSGMDSDGIPTRRVLRSSPFGAYSRSCAFWACRTTGCRSHALFFYEGPHNIRSLPQDAIGRSVG